MFIPLEDFILVKADEAAQSKNLEGGKKIFLANNTEKPPMGTILRIGRMAQKTHPELKPNMRIVYQQYCGDEVWMYNALGNRIPNMITIRAEDIRGYDDGSGSEMLPPAVDNSALDWLPKKFDEPEKPREMELSCYNNMCEKKFCVTTVKVLGEDYPVCGYCGTMMERKRTAPLGIVH